MAKFYGVDGSIKEVKPKNGKFFSYEELQSFIKEGDDGMVEIVPLPDGRSIVVNEEGKLIGLPENENASAVWRKLYPKEKYPHNNDELVVGNALIAREEEFEQD